MIISAWDIYFICKLNTIQLLTGLTAFFSLLLYVFFIIMCNNTVDGKQILSDAGRTAAKFIFILTLIISVFMPDTKTYLAMRIVPNLVTAENINNTTEKITKIMKDVFESVDNNLNRSK